MRKLYCFIHGLIFSFGSPLIIYSIRYDSNIYFHPKSIISSILFSITLFIVLSIVSFLLSNDPCIAGLVSTCMILGLIYIWPIFLIVLIAIPITLFVIKIIRKKIFLRDAHLVLSVLSLIIVGYYTIVFFNQIKGEPIFSPSLTLQPIKGIPPSISSNTVAPDIFYIILDGYGRSDMLQNEFGINNSYFIDELITRGFFVGSKSQSNYTRTLHSLSSSLNMQYIEEISTKLGGSLLWWPLANPIQHSQVRGIFENWGYKTIFFASGWDYTDIRDGDIYKTPYPIMLNNFEANFLSFTNFQLLSNIDQTLIAFQSNSTLRKTITFTLNELPEAALIPGPKFVFAHILALHPPYVLDQEGIQTNPEMSFTLKNLNPGNIEALSSYQNQLIIINDLLLDTIDNIIHNSASPPIIIIQGDHGPDILFNTKSIENSCLYERFSIFNAYYLPGKYKYTIPSDISPVNTFRMIFNNYFESNLDYLPNKQYISTYYQLHQFTEVTGQTQDPCQAHED